MRHHLFGPAVAVVATLVVAAVAVAPRAAEPVAPTGVARLKAGNARFVAKPCRLTR